MFEFLSKNCIAISKKSGLVASLGIGATNVNSSGLKLVSVAGITSTLPKNNSPASTAIWSLVSLFTTTSSLNSGINGILTIPKSNKISLSTLSSDSKAMTPLLFLTGSPNKCIFPTACEPVEISDVSKSFKFWFILLPLIKNLTLDLFIRLPPAEVSFVPTFNTGRNRSSYWTLGLILKSDKFVSNIKAWECCQLLPDIWIPCIIEGVVVSPNWKLPVDWTPLSLSPTAYGAPKMFP